MGSLCEHACEEMTLGRVSVWCVDKKFYETFTAISSVKSLTAVCTQLLNQTQRLELMLDIRQRSIRVEQKVYLVVTAKHL
jgi:hypothetical protein